MSTDADNERPAAEGLGAGILALCFARLAAALGASMVLVALPLSVAALPAASLLGGLSTSTRVGVMISMYGLVLALGQPLVGRYGKETSTLRLMVLLGMGTFGLATAALCWAPAYEILLLLRVLQGGSIALTIPPVLALISRFSHAGRRGAAMGMYGTLRMTGFGLGPLLGGAIIHVLDLSWVYLIAVLPAVVAVVIVGMGVPRAEAPRAAEAGSGAAGEDDVSDDTAPLAPFMLLGLGFVVTAACTSSIVVLENDFLDRLDQTTLSFGAAVGALILTRVALDWPVGRLADRIPRRPLLMSGLLLIAPATIMQGQVTTSLGLIACRMFMGVGLSLFSTPALTLASDRAQGRDAAFRLSLVTSGFAWGLALGPFATGLLAARFGFEAPFWLLGGLAVVAGLLVFPLIDEVEEA